jgi:hypothetical protein
VRMRVTVLCFITFVLLINTAAAQSPEGTVSGIVLDPSGGVIVGADVLIISDATGVQYPGKANSEGYYVVPNISPGTYRIQVSNRGFKTIIKPDIVIHIQDALAINFTLPIGAASEIVTVEGGAPLVNTESAAVGTVVDRKYVENMPLNGRSFQDLIRLTPGIVTSSPQTGANNLVNTQGEFSVNGQRTESNYYTVDGVSANIGVVAGNPRVATSGSLPASTSLGTTQALVSVDALEEFRVQSSTYSAEYGRNPGGQFSFATRSGTNQWHGTAYDYLRNDIFDANDWFNHLNGQAKPALRQNDFGGTLGGPFEIPRLYNGKEKTFFFFSYEGLRLSQPQPATVSYVPDMALRSASTALQPVLNSFPLPNCTNTTPSCINPGNGLAGFIGTWSNPSQIDSTAVRFDHAFKDTLKLFFRFSDTSSTGQSRSSLNPANVNSQSYTTRTYTVGATSAILSGVSNEFRFNYSLNESKASSRLSNFAGAQAVDLVKLQGEDPIAYPFSQVDVGLFFGPYSANVGQGPFSGKQTQWNLVDSVAFSRGRHQSKVGVDFRRLGPVLDFATPFASYFYFSESSAQANLSDFAFAKQNGRALPVYINFSAFAQDEWRVTPRLNLSAGLRWEVNPAPGGARSNRPYTLEGPSISTLALAPQGTPLWNTTWYNFAPRLGAAYILRNRSGFETVVRGGGGVFYDTGQQLGSFGFQGPGFSQQENFFGVAGFPLPFAQINPPIVNPPVLPFNGTVFGFPRHLQLPYTLQWNASIQQALGNSQALTVSYVGSNGRRLLEENEIQNVNPNFPDMLFVRSGLTSHYDALQVQFQRRLAAGLTALASYTWSHSIDFGSNDAALPFTRGNSDFDVRHNVSGAFSYDLPNAFRNQFGRAVLQHWGIDERFTARTGFPVTLSNGNSTVIDPATGQTYEGGVNLVSGVPIDLYGPQYPGGRSINPAAFSSPPSTEVGNAPRNFVRGFGAWQLDMAVRREFPIHDRLRLQFRAEVFNVFNHPNFGTVDGIFGQSTFGQATATLAQSLGTLGHLYQTGGPRSMQFALKLAF